VALKNVTITLDEEVARWARIRAAELETSVSRLVGDLLRQKMLEDQSYDAAMREYLALPGRRLRKSADTRYPRRADLHGR
jgi:plasmid stability protein